MRSQLLKALVIGWLLTILLGMPLLFTPHRIHFSNVKRITTDMTIADVVELLGAQPGYYDGYDRSPGRRRAPCPADIAVWCSRHCWIAVKFDERDRVFSWDVCRSAPATWLAKLWDSWAPPPMVLTEAVSSE